MATLQKNFSEFNSAIRLDPKKKESLVISRKSIKNKIVDYFKNEKSKELQPSFRGQGSFEMNTIVNPIIEKNEDGDPISKYDLDYGVYFVEIEGEDNKKAINTWHGWVFDAVDDHTNTPSKDKSTCVRVCFAAGHHIDLPIYYESKTPYLGHKIKGWVNSNPVEFTDWFNSQVVKDQQLRRIVRYLKAWKNFREVKNSSLKFPSGFALTILAANNFKPDEDDDIAFKLTVESILAELTKSFRCIRPTTPAGEDVFQDFSKSREDGFLKALKSLKDDCVLADSENNFKAASEYLIKHFGDRFPLGKDQDVKSKKESLSKVLSTSIIEPKPFSNGWQA